MPESYNDWPNHAGFDVLHEELTPIELKVKGRIPEYALGTLYRTGPGGYQLPITPTSPSSKPETFSISHWFDGFAQVHRFQLTSPTTVLYNSRHISDGILAHIKTTGKLPSSFSFAQRDPCQSLFRKFMSVFLPAPAPPKNPGNIYNVAITISTDFPGLPSTSKDGKKIRNLYTKTDANVLQGLDPETLEPTGLARQQMLHPDLNGQLSAAHSRTDPATGDVFNYNLHLGATTATYKIFQVTASTGKTKILATIADAPAAYIHSFFLTERYVILCVFAAEFGSTPGLSLMFHKNILDAIKPVDVRKPVRWYVVDRTGEGKGVVGRYESKAPFFAFHTINAWEEERREEDGGVDVVAEVPVYENLDVLHKFYIRNLLGNTPEGKEWAAKGPQAVLTRFRLEKVGAVVDGMIKGIVGEVRKESEARKEWGMELPTLNSAFVTRKHRYTYAVTNRQKATLSDGIVKRDSETGEYKCWEEHAHTPGEAAFVADPEGTEEDDGVLMSVVLDGRLEKSYLLVLDARTMTEVARAEMETAVGFGFHGKHIGSSGNGTEF